MSNFSFKRDILYRLIPYGGRLIIVLWGEYNITGHHGSSWRQTSYIEPLTEKASDAMTLESPCGHPTAIYLGLLSTRNISADT